MKSPESRSPEKRRDGSGILKLAAGVLLIAFGAKAIGNFIHHP